MKRTILLIILFLGLQFLCNMVMMLAWYLDGHPDFNLLGLPPSAIGISLSASGLLTWLCMNRLGWTDKERFRRLGYSGAVYAGMAGMMTAAIFVVNLLTEAFELEDVNAGLMNRLIYNPWGIIAVVFAGPFSEEVVFRMGIQGHLMKRRMRPWTAILTTAVLFGVIHGNPAQIPGAVLFGILLGWLYWRAGNLWMPLAAHILNNLLGVSLVWLTGNADLTITELCGGTGPAVCVALAATAAGTCLMYYLDRKFPDATPQNKFGNP